MTRLLRQFVANGSFTNLLRRIEQSCCFLGENFGLAVSNPIRPEFSNLLLARPVGDNSVADGLLDLHGIVRKRNARRTKPVALSACETAMGHASRGDEAQSLATAFLCDGTREVIASLRSVDDRATARIMDDCYTALSGGKPSARALHESMIRQAGSGKHPYDWAAFQLIGNRCAGRGLSNRNMNSAIDI